MTSDEVLKVKEASAGLLVALRAAQLAAYVEDRAMELWLYDVMQDAIKLQNRIDAAAACYQPRLRRLGN